MGTIFDRVQRSDIKFMEQRMKKEYGYFNNGGHQYVITDPATPRHWYNYLWNDRYITFISQVGYGEGFAQDDMGRRAQLLINRQLYLIDSEENEFWTANALPINRGYSDYQCTHGIGYTVLISMSKNFLVWTW